MKMLETNGKRLLSEIERIASFGMIAGKGINRLALSDHNRDARDAIVIRMERLGMTVHIDQIGNIIGIRKGKLNSNPVMTGSHIDTVKSGGKLDGAYGIIAGLEAIETLNELRIETERPLAVTVFTNEEGIRYQPDMMGSLAYSGGIEIDTCLGTVGKDGSILGAELKRIGYDGTIACGQIRPHAFIELHVEQGPRLYRQQSAIGIVQAVSGISWFELNIQGTANHAGTTPLGDRQDAGLIAAKVICFVRELVQSIGGNQLGTCGVLELEPGNINVIPGKARLSVDLRNPDNGTLRQAESRFRKFIDTLAEAEKVPIEVNPLVRFDPIAFNPKLIEMITQTADRFKFQYEPLVSGAGHDAQMMGRICPAAMIFVPSIDGISHNIQEQTSPDDLKNGADLLLNCLLRLTNKRQHH